MLHRFTLKRVGYNSTIKIGEVIEYEKQKYVVIQINNFKTRQGKNGIVATADVITQKYGSKNNGLGFKERGLVHKKFDTRKMNAWDNKINGHVGDIDFIKGGVAFQIMGITDISYDFTDMLVEYEFFKIREWSKSEMDDAINENRLSKFKVLNGKG